uniref:Uncharacterized protein n=1 Tax=Arundo donax TaxID=35708 RepID=A0A0A9ECN4_ARUDO
MVSRTRTCSVHLVGHATFSGKHRPKHALNVVTTDKAY